MDEQKNSSFIQWDIGMGDLVRVVNHLMHYGGTIQKIEYGIVMGEAYKNQISLFPEVKVYLFDSKVIRTFTAGSLEIISHAHEPPTY